MFLFYLIKIFFCFESIFRDSVLHFYFSVLQYPFSFLVVHVACDISLVRQNEKETIWISLLIWMLDRLFTGAPVIIQFQRTNLMLVYIFKHFAIVKMSCTAKNAMLPSKSSSNMTQAMHTIIWTLKIINVVGNRQTKCQKKCGH